MDSSNCIAKSPRNKTTTKNGINQDFFFQFVVASLLLLYIYLTHIKNLPKAGVLSIGTTL